MADSKGSLVPELMFGSRNGDTTTVGQPVIQCQNLTKYFGASCAVNNVDLALESGEILALVGPSGGGKTTCLRLLAGFEAPDSGTVGLGGNPVAGNGTWVPPEARRLGMVFQDYALFPHMTVLQNVAFGLKNGSGAAKQRRAQDMLEMVRLPHVAERHPHQLSGGEQQRIALARSLAPRPLALLLDEPFSNLDPQLRGQLRADVRSILRSSGVTSVYVTHSRDEALYMGDRIAVMNGGSLEQVDTPEDIFHYPRSRFVAEFMGQADFIHANTTEDGLVTEIGALRSETIIPAGVEVDVMVRPDDVAIYPASSGMGRVVSRVFRGMHYLYGLSLPSGAVVHSIQHHTAYYQLGDAVDIYLEPNQRVTCFLNGESAASKQLDEAFPATTVEQASKAV